MAKRCSVRATGASISEFLSHHILNMHSSRNQTGSGRRTVRYHEIAVPLRLLFATWRVPSEVQYTCITRRQHIFWSNFKPKSTSFSGIVKQTQSITQKMPKASSTNHKLKKVSKWIFEQRIYILNKGSFCSNQPHIINTFPLKANPPAAQTRHPSIQLCLFWNQTIERGSEYLFCAF